MMPRSWSEVERRRERESLFLAQAEISDQEIGEIRGEKGGQEREQRTKAWKLQAEIKNSSENRQKTENRRKVPALCDPEA